MLVSRRVMLISKRFIGDIESISRRNAEKMAIIDEYFTARVTRSLYMVTGRQLIPRRCRRVYAYDAPPTLHAAYDALRRLTAAISSGRPPAGQAFLA